MPAKPIEGVDIEAILNWPELADVKAELDDPRFGNRKHGSRATKALKCDGPLCRKAERDRARKRNESRALAAGRNYQASVHRMSDRDALLDAIIEWHVKALATRRKAAS